MSKKIEASESGATSEVRLGLGRWSLSLNCGGSTVEIQAKAYGELASQYKTLILPDGASTDTSTDSIIECQGGLDYRFDVTTYVDAVKATFSSIGD